MLKIHENDDVNKALLLLLFISDISKRVGSGNIYDLIDKESKRKYLKKRTNPQNNKLENKKYWNQDWSREVKNLHMPVKLC